MIKTIELTEQELNAIAVLVGSRMIQLQRDNKHNSEAYQVYESVVTKTSNALDLG